MDIYNNQGHEFMANNMIPKLSDAIKAYGMKLGYQLSNQFYNDLAWGGLTHYESSPGTLSLSPWFINHVPNSTDRNRILQTITNEFSGNSSNQNGTNAGC